VAQAREQARDVEALLRGRRWRASLRSMYGNEPAAWSRKLDREARRRYTINALTRMRYCDRRGRLELRSPARRDRSRRSSCHGSTFRSGARAARISCSAIGPRSGVTAPPGRHGLDSGCVWGNCLTAVRLDKPARPVKVECTAALLGRDPRARR
jgi:bis(5'-nucleosyl)-tetraphosphatase (symmetrical)